jgi:transposase
VPAETARVARLAFRRGHPYLALRDALETLFTDATFQDLFATRGRPAEAPWRLALVSLLQFAENLSDRQAADAVRSRLDWKYLLSLELTDAGFDYSLLCDFRARLLAGSAELRLFELLLNRCREQELLKARGRQRTDATHVLAAVRTLHRLELVGETLRYALNTLAAGAPAWLEEQCGAHFPAWAQRYGRRVEEFRLPRSRAEREALAVAIGEDGYTLLTALAAPTTPAAVQALPAVGTLFAVWRQQYYREEPPAGGAPRGRWRTGEELPPASVQIHSPYDPEARYAREEEGPAWVGYTLHVTESCDPERPVLITDVQTTPAPQADQQVLPVIQAALARRNLLPKEQLVDAGYVQATLLVTSAKEYGITLLGPTMPNTSWQVRVGAGFTAADFVIDWAAQQAHCPGGKTSRRWQAGEREGQPFVKVDFSRLDCGPCPLRAQCTQAAQHGRRLTLLPQAEHEALAAARRREREPAFREQYAARAGIEATHSQGVRRCGVRRCRYRGQAKVHLQHILTAAALNFVRLGDWFFGKVRAKSRTDVFLRLALAGI